MQIESFLLELLKSLLSEEAHAESNIWLSLMVGSRYHSD